MDAENISLTGTALVPSVFVACDTRKTGQTLCNHARDAALALKVCPQHVTIVPVLLDRRFVASAANCCTCVS